MSKYYHKNCSQTSQKEEAREETHMEKVWSYHNDHHISKKYMNSIKKFHYVVVEIQ